MKTLAFIFTILTHPLVINGEIFSTLVDLEQETTVKAAGVTTKKPILRYGFQKTEACKDFEKAFLCVRKCLDLNYDVAYSDKNCKCTCYTKPEKAQYTVNPDGQTRTLWRLGAPTTRKPIWAQPKTDPGDVAPEANHSEDNGDNDHENVNKPDDGRDNKTYTVNDGDKANEEGESGATQHASEEGVTKEDEDHGTESGVTQDVSNEQGDSNEAQESTTEGEDDATEAPSDP